jgi:hypothetical protein
MTSLMMLYGTFFGGFYQMFFGGAYDDYLWGAKKVFNDLSQKKVHKHRKAAKHPREVWNQSAVDEYNPNPSTYIDIEIFKRRF